MIILTKTDNMYTCLEGQEADMLKDIVKEELGSDCLLLLNKIMVDYRDEYIKEISLLKEEREEFEREIDGWVAEIRNIKDEIDGIIENDKLTKKAIIDSLYRLSHNIHSML